MNLLILSYYKYPDGDAGSVRHHAFAKLFLSLDHDVTVAGAGKSTNFRFLEYDGVRYTSFRHSGKSFITKIKNIIGYKNKLKKLMQNKKFDLVLLNDIPYSVLKYMKRYAGKHSIKLYYDSVEWYSPEQFTFGKRNISYYLKEKTNTKWIDSQFSVIAISKYLENHFKSRGIKTARIPAILDIGAMSCEKHVDQNKTVIMYAGSPGRKDYLREVIGGCLLLAQDELSRTELRLAGVNRDQLISHCGISAEAIQNLGDRLITYGRLPHAKVLELLAEADFTVLLRPPDLQYTKAGFPTKVAESLACGTPVLCNITSDLSDYLTDENSIIVESCTSEAFAAAVKTALRLTSEQKEVMSHSARRCAEENFDYRLYKEEIRKILSL